MNDEELRAFLDSATVGDDDGATDHEEDAPEILAADVASPTVTDAAPRRVVPSFDELMNMPGPDAAPAQRAPEAAPVSQAAVAPAAPPAAAPAPAAAEPVRPAVVQEPKAAVVPETREWSQAYAQEDEQLVPLILPGFSSAPRPTRDLPPVFQADPAAPKEPETQHVDPAPTQPFDVLSDSHVVEQKVAPVASASGLAAAATTPLSAAGHSPAAPVASAQVTSGLTGSATPATGVSAAQTAENPFALLAPELAVPSSDEGEYEYERISVTGGAPRGRKALPWLIVGGGAVIAIIASIFVINGVRGNDVTAPTEKPAVTAEPAPDETTSPASEPEPSEEPAPEPTTAPVVDPGSTWSLRIDQWGIAVEVSEKLGGSTPYTLFDGDSRAMFDSVPVAAGFSDGCAAARAEHVWGLLKKEDGTLEVIRPEPRCTDPSDAAVYDTIWGVLDYMAKSAKPA